jgi:hypothetical protein
MTLESARHRISGNNRQPRRFGDYAHHALNGMGRCGVGLASLATEIVGHEGKVPTSEDVSTWVAKWSSAVKVPGRVWGDKVGWCIIQAAKSTLLWFLGMPFFPQKRERWIKHSVDDKSLDMKQVFNLSATSFTHTSSEIS